MTFEKIRDYPLFFLLHVQLKPYYSLIQLF
jgi:hypothetical protein